jgi:hypothetical protein
VKVVIEDEATFEFAQNFKNAGCSPPPPSKRETLAIAISVGGCQQLSRAMHSDEEALVFKYNGDVAADMVK